MTDRELKEIREKISCTQFGDDHYGEWGILTPYQRRTIKRMLDFINILEEENKMLRIYNGLKTDEQVKGIIHETFTMKWQIEAEAIKEFAERLKERTNFFDISIIIDDLVKEMVGDSNGGKQ